METGHLINELTQGIHLANQLKNNLDKTMPPQTCDFLVDKILSSYEKALSMVNFGEFSPLHSSHYTSKKRKAMAKWSEQVKVCSGSMVEGPLSDGYSWRKYGQKDILGANYPRAYYRCTHRSVQGCLATKQVQKSDEDLSVFEVTYKGRHTCIQAKQLLKVLEKKQHKEEENIQESKPTKKICMERTFSFKATKGVNVREEGLFPSFSFDSTSLETEKLENLFYLGCDSTIDHNLQSSDSDLSEMINSTPNSSTNSPLEDWESLEFDVNFLSDITDSEMFVSNSYH